MNKVLHGTVQGKAINIAEELELEDGAQVEIILLRTLPPHQWGEGIRRSAGVAADEPEFDAVFRQIEQERKSATFRESGE